MTSPYTLVAITLVSLQVQLTHYVNISSAPKLLCIYHQGANFILNIEN